MSRLLNVTAHFVNSRHGKCLEAICHSLVSGRLQFIAKSDREGSCSTM